MSEELANIGKMELKMDHDPDVPASIEDEIRNARANIGRSNDDTKELAYWAGVVDGLETAFKMIKRKDG